MKSMEALSNRTLVRDSLNFIIRRSSETLPSIAVESAAYLTKPLLPLVESVVDPVVESLDHRIQVVIKTFNDKVISPSVEAIDVVSKTYTAMINIPDKCIEFLLDKGSFESESKHIEADFDQLFWKSTKVFIVSIPKTLSGFSNLYGCLRDLGLGSHILGKAYLTSQGEGLLSFSIAISVRITRISQIVFGVDLPKKIELIQSILRKRDQYFSTVYPSGEHPSAASSASKTSTASKSPKASEECIEEEPAACSPINIGALSIVDISEFSLARLSIEVPKVGEDDLYDPTEARVLAFMNYLGELIFLESMYRRNFTLPASAARPKPSVARPSYPTAAAVPVAAPAAFAA